MYKALVHSVPGSGTRFICEFCEKALGYKRSQSEKELIAFHGGRTYCHTHVWQALDDVARNESVRVVIPLRHPYLAYLTRRYRVGRPSDTPEKKRRIIAGHWKEMIRRVG